MVAEAVAETQVPAPEVAQQAPPSEPTPEVQEEAPDEELIESLREQGLISADYGRSQDAAPATEAHAAPDISKLSPEEAKAQGQREEREAGEQRRNQTERQNYEAGVRYSHQTRKPAVMQRLGEMGLDANTILWVGEQFDQHHGQSLALAKFDQEVATKQQAQQFVQTVYPAAVKALGAQGKKFEAEGYHESWDDSPKGFVGALIKHAREGYVTPAQAKKQTDEAVVKATAKMRAAGEHPAGRTTAAPAGARGAGIRGPASRAEAELMHAGMHPSGRTITTSQMRRYLSTGNI